MYNISLLSNTFFKWTHYRFTNFYFGGWSYINIFVYDANENEIGHQGVSLGTDPENVIYTEQIINNYPNPFNISGNTTISYYLKNNINQPKIEIYNIKGQKVKTLQINNEPGAGEVVWNGTNMLEQNVSPGIYLYRMIDAGKCVDTKKMLLLR